MTDNAFAFRAVLFDQALGRASHRPPLLPALPAADHRQGGAVQPHPARGVGVRPYTRDCDRTRALPGGCTCTTIIDRTAHSEVNRRSAVSPRSPAITPGRAARHSPTTGEAPPGHNKKQPLRLTGGAAFVQLCSNSYWGPGAHSTTMSWPGAPPQATTVEAPANPAVLLTVSPGGLHSPAALSGLGAALAGAAPAPSIVTAAMAAQMERFMPVPSPSPASDVGGAADYRLVERT